MNNNRVEILLTAKDEISGTIRGITGAIAAMATGLVAAVGIKNGIMSAASAQTSMIASAGDLSTLMGTKFADSLKVVKEVQGEISKIAAALPGETAGYGEIATSITAGVAEASKGDLKVFKSNVTEISKILGFLAASKGVDMTQAAQASNKFVTGSGSLSEMFGSNDIFQKNTLFRKYLQEELKKIGKNEKDWQTLTADTRIAVIKSAGKRAMPQDVIDNLNGTTDALIQGIKTSLFDPNTGLFGFLRAVKGLKGRTGLDTVQEYLKNLTDFGESIGKALDKAGIDLDPMIAIGGFFDFLSDITKGLNQVVSGQGMGNLQGMLNKGMEFFSLENIAKYATGFGKGLTDTLNNASGKQAGKMWGDWVKYVFDAIRTMVSGINWGNLGKNLYRLITEFISSVDWYGVFVAVASALLSLIKAAVELLVSWVYANIRDFLSAIQTTDWKSVFSGLGDTLTTVLQSATEGIVSYVKEGIQKSLSAITDDISKVYENSKLKAFLEKMGFVTPTPASTAPVGGTVNKSLGQPLKPMKMPVIGTPMSSLSDEAIPLANGLAVAPMLGNTTGNTFAPVIQITGVASDLQTTADYVMAKIEQAYQEYQGAVLT